MANTALYGFRWVRALDGGSDDPPVMPYRIASAYNGTLGGTAIDINIGDPITQLNTGYHAVAAGSEGTQANIAAVVVGVGPYYDSNLGRMTINKKLPNQQGAYSTNYERETFVYGIPVEGQVFEIDCDDTSSSYDTYAEYLAFVGENADHILLTGSEPKANPKLDISTHNTTYSLQWRIVDIAKRIDQDYASAGVKLYVTCNRVQGKIYAYDQAAGAGTTGV
jgi:hypothetical protein